MSFEVELKFPVADLAELRGRLDTLDVHWQEERRQVDRYFAHPQRDFAQTDEALRIRSVGRQNVITYKGAKIDAETKTREEIELPIAPEQAGAESFTQLLGKLGFRPVAIVAKTRTTGHLTYQNQAVEVALDQVDRLGSFVELETTSDQADLDAARAALLELARQWKLEHPERRGYLEMLLNAE